jgi:CDP-diacylglycerol--glycerol-3-phosphate 3-phosphatidyltransferase
MLISYERAKAEALGFDARGGLMERAERLVALAIGLLFSALLIPMLFLMLALTVFTAVQRFLKVWNQASADRPNPRQQLRRERRARRRATRSTWATRSPASWQRRTRKPD